MKRSPFPGEEVTPRLFATLNCSPLREKCRRALPDLFFRLRGSLFRCSRRLGRFSERQLAVVVGQIGELIRIQRRILQNAFAYVRPGGRVEYSTCTLNKNENEKVVKDMLSKAGSSARIIEMETLLPYNGKVGFFYSIIEKTAK